MYLLQQIGFMFLGLNFSLISLCINLETGRLQLSLPGLLSRVTVMSSSQCEPFFGQSQPQLDTKAGHHLLQKLRAMLWLSGLNDGMM